MNLVTSAFGDAQTTVASLAAGIGGTASSLAGDYVIQWAGGRTSESGGIGAIGLQFCARAVISAAIFSGLTYAMPETSGNVFFSILYFAADRGLMGSALTISGATIGALRQLKPVAPKMPPSTANFSTANCSTCK